MDVSVVIVNWNTGDLLRRCLASLRAACSADTFEVIVVENASTDDSVRRAEASGQPFRLIQMDVNAGFARANNVGIREAKGGTVLLLNPDTEPRPGSLSALVRFLREHPASVVGPRLLNTDGTLQPSCRTFPTTLVLALLFLKAHRLFPRLSPLRRYDMEEFQHDAERTVDQIMGACMALPRAVLEKVGLLDEGYWIWFEEVDWCRRARARGIDIWFTPRAEVVHHGGVSFRQVLPVRKEWRFLRSALRYARIHLGVPAALLLMPLVPVALLLDALLFIPWLKTSVSVFR
jgi:N-acetylglucosaminyl-diphospho-decaprenol L-rhamnosyltransferase